MNPETSLTLDPLTSGSQVHLPKPTLVLDRLLEKNLLPDWLIRIGIRRLLRERLREEDRGNARAQQAHLLQLIEGLRQSPIAVQTQAAN